MCCVCRHMWLCDGHTCVVVWWVGMHGCVVVIHVRWCCGQTCVMVLWADTVDYHIAMGPGFDG
jgi:hypothetical protein